MSTLDQPQAVRPGEELDQARLHQFLREALPDGDAPLSVQQFPSGFSNLTYMLKLGDRELVLRRPPFGTKPKSGHDMAREFRVLSALEDHLPYAPRPLAFCEDESVLGAPFYVMERLCGVIVRRDLPPEWKLTPTDVRTLTTELVDVLAQIHSVDLAQTGLSSLGRVDGYVERQVQGWTKRYRRCRTEDVPDAEDVMAALTESMPSPCTTGALIHNDYKLDNVVFSPELPVRIIGVLDWEMTTIGDPLMDLGCTLAYWVEASDSPESLGLRVMPTHLEGAMTRQEFVERYCEKTGRSLTDMRFYHAFGLFRLAVIVQQIYYRYVQGQTQDSRFAHLGHWVTGLEQGARRVLAGEKP